MPAKLDTILFCICYFSGWLGLGTLIIAGITRQLPRRLILGGLGAILLAIAGTSFLIADHWIGHF